MSDSDQDAGGSADELPPWTVRDVSHEARSAARKMADRSRQKIGPWLSRAILEHIGELRREPRHVALAEQVPRGAPAAGMVVQLDPAAIVAAVDELLRAARDVQEATGHPPPRSLARRLYSLLALRARLAAWTVPVPVVRPASLGVSESPALASPES